MRKFMRRTIKNISEIDSMNASEKTVFYDTSKASQMSHTETTLSEK